MYIHIACQRQLLFSCFISSGLKPLVPNRRIQPNQDRAFIQNLGPSLVAFAIFDGHGNVRMIKWEIRGTFLSFFFPGKYGHDVSEFVCESFKSLLLEEFGTEQKRKESLVLHSEKELAYWIKNCFQKVDVSLVIWMNLLQFGLLIWATYTEALDTTTSRDQPTLQVCPEIPHRYALLYYVWNCWQWKYWICGFALSRCSLCWICWRFESCWLLVSRWLSW